MTKTIIITIREAENGFILELASNHQSVKGKEYVALGPRELITTAKSVFGLRLDDIVSEFHQ